MCVRILRFDLGISVSEVLVGRVSADSNNSVAEVVGVEVDFIGTLTLPLNGRNGSCVKSVKEWAPMQNFDSGDTALVDGALLSKDAAQARKLFVEDSSSIALKRYLSNDVSGK